MLVVSDDSIPFRVGGQEQVDTDLLEIEKGRVAVFRNAANALDSAGL